MKIIVYTKVPCPYCVQAKNLLSTKGLSFEEIDLTNKPQELVALKEKSGLRTVPQIFINDQLIGGFSELYELNQKGELDRLASEDSSV